MLQIRLSAWTLAGTRSLSILVSAGPRKWQNAESKIKAFSLRCFQPNGGWGMESAFLPNLRCGPGRNKCRIQVGGVRLLVDLQLQSV